jgi:alanine racemase
MGRNGFTTEWPELLERDLSKVVGVMTHFARADEPNEAQNSLQLKNFDDRVAELVAKGVNPVRHISNTAATLSNSVAKYDMVRVGIAMYGLSPLGKDSNFEPVMKVRAKLVLVKEMPASHPIGYGATVTTTSETKIGIVGMGYADGIPRNAIGAGVTFQGESAPLIGRVSMDQFAVDFGANSKAKSGDWVTVIGENYDTYDWAEACQTITYEITTRMGGRIKRIYQES